MPDLHQIDIRQSTTVSPFQSECYSPGRPKRNTIARSRISISPKIPALSRIGNVDSKAVHVLSGRYSKRRRRTTIYIPVGFRIDIILPNVPWSRIRFGYERDTISWLPRAPKAQVHPVRGGLDVPGVARPIESPVLVRAIVTRPADNWGYRSVCQTSE